MEINERLTENGVNSAPDVFQADSDIYGKPTKTIPKPEKNIGVDLNGTLYQNIIDNGINGKLDTSDIDRFTQISEARGQLYNMIDSMTSDPTIATGLEIYAENLTEYNTEGKIVWAESEDKEVAEYVNFLLDSINVDKYAYTWIYSMIKYGDLYLRLYRKSDYDDPIFNGDKKDKTRQGLNEQVKIKSYSKHDRYANYVEMVKDPATMFELTKFGKTMGYIETKGPSSVYNDMAKLTNQYLSYTFDKSDVNVYEPTEFVHASLNDNTSRYAETVNISIDKSDTQYTYDVRKGKSILYDLYKLWRQQSLLENSVILNRVTRSSITRILAVDVGDMEKSQVQQRLTRIKSMIEQKAAIKSGEGMSEYTDPGPVENIIYLPVNGEKGNITQTTIGGDVNVGDLVDLEYFKNKYYGAFGIPKQYMGETGDSAGFDAGSSLAQISSKFAKRCKRLQVPFIQAIEQLVNLMLEDRDLNGYIGKFTIKMTPQGTKEEQERQDNLVTRVGLVNEVVNAVSNVIDDEDVRLQVLRTMLTSTIGETRVPSIVDEYIQKRAREKEDEEEQENAEQEIEDTDSFEESSRATIGRSQLNRAIGREVPEDGSGFDVGHEISDSTETQEVVLPMPEELGRDFTDNEEQ